MLTVPLLADFAVRLAFGLILALILTSWREVPAAILPDPESDRPGHAGPRGTGPGEVERTSLALWLVIAGASWLIWPRSRGASGCPGRIAAGILGVLVTAAWMVDASRSADAGLWALNALSRSASGLLLGATLTAMLLGHYYLIAPAMTIEPLKRSLNLIAVGLDRALPFRRDRHVGREGWTVRFGFGRARPRRDVPGHAMGNGIRGRGGVGVSGPADGRDPIDPIGDGNPLHHHDLRPVRRADVDRGCWPRVPIC